MRPKIIQVELTEIISDKEWVCFKTLCKMKGFAGAKYAVAELIRDCLKKEGMA